jgi:hypothetical protein
MDVEIAGKHIRLNQRQVIGAGGEGTVFRVRVGNRTLAVKLYHTPTTERQEKLTEMVSRSWQLPERKIALPDTIVRAPTGEIVGFGMPLLAGTPVEVAKLAQKKFRLAQGLSLRQIIKLFLDGAETLEILHRNGLVVGDMNDRNLLFNGQELYWIDVDAWQFGRFACPVATEDFLAPELYGFDLSLRPCFRPEHDWYAFAVHLFRSLLLVHPYGGVHQQVALLTERAAQRLYVLDAAVLYPKIASSPAILSDELLGLFERIFAQGWRGTFPLSLLQAYREELLTCSACKMEYPAGRKQCPHCQVHAQLLVMPAVASAAGVRVHEILRTAGNIVYSTVRGGTIYALAHEGSLAVLYTKRDGERLTRRVLFPEVVGARYALAANILAISLPETEPISSEPQPAGNQSDQSGLQKRQSLLCLALEEDQLRAVGTVSTACFLGGSSAMFQGSEAALYTIHNGSLLAQTLLADELVGRAQRSVMDQHTWFRVAETGPQTIFGYFQVFARQMYWLCHGKASYELALAELAAEERLLDIAVYFGETDLLVRRQTLERGHEYLRSEIIDHQGQLVHQAPRIQRKEHPCPALHGLAYTRGMLLHATDDGIVQERVMQRTFKPFSGTKGIVREGMTLIPYHRGLLAIGEQQILQIHG